MNRNTQRPGMARTIGLAAALGLHGLAAGQSDCVSPTVSSTINPGLGLAVGVDINPPYAFLTTSDLFIYDVSDPASPQQIGWYDPGAYLATDEVFGVVAAGSLVFLSTEQGMTVLDVSNPASPQRLSHTLTLGAVSALDIEGDTVCLVTGSPNSSVQIIDVSNPSAPLVLSGTPLPSGVGHSVSMEWPYLCVGTTQGELLVYDIASLTSPQLLGTLDVGPGFVEDLELEFPTVYAATGRIHSVSLATPSQPMITYSSTGGSGRFAMTEDTFYVANGRLWVWGRTTPGTLDLIGQGITPGLANDAAYAGGHVYIADYLNGLTVMDVRDDCRDSCEADTNGDGVLDNGDIVTFVSLFLASDQAADMNGDGILDNGDINAFVQLFLAGC